MGNGAPVTSNRPVSTTNGAKPSNGSGSDVTKGNGKRRTEFSGGSCMAFRSRQSVKAAPAAVQPPNIDTHRFSRPLPRRRDELIREIEAEEELSDEHVDHAQGLLRDQFPETSGFLSISALTATSSSDIQRAGSGFVQIFHIGDRHHWICASNVHTTRPDRLVLYDSSICVEPNASFELQEKLAALMHVRRDVTIQWVDVKRQQNSVDCGVYAIAAATAICYGVEPELCDWRPEGMRAHLVDCFRSNRMVPFPVFEDLRIPAQPRFSVIRIRCACCLPVNKSDTQTWIRCVLCDELFHRKCVEHTIREDAEFCCEWCMTRIRARK